MRINLFGSPGCGKSTTATLLFSNLKILNYSIELITEYIKTWTYINRKPTSFDQVYIFGQQMQKEHLPLKAGVQHIITDSPLLLSPIYGKHYNYSSWKQLLEIERIFNDSYPSVNFLLQRSHEYQQLGRFETQEQSVEIEKSIINFLKEYNIPYEITNNNNILEILKKIL